MTELPRKKLGFKQPAVGSRTVIDLAQTPLIRESQLPIGRLPLVIEPAVEDVDWIAWASNPQTRALIQQRVTTHGGVLFRGFPFSTVSSFQQFIVALSGPLIEYQERSSPRSQVEGFVYTSTDHPAAQTIFLHNEHSYNLTWPLKISFCCLVPAATGGETPIADCRTIVQHIDPAIRQRFIDKQYLYVRNFGSGFGLAWQTAFQTDDPATVEAYCRAKQIEVEWRGDGRLRTRQIRPAVARHPHSGELTWFNHATFFHVSTLEPAVRDALLAEFAEEDLPNNTYYGDGTPIEASVLDELRGAYTQAMVSFPWQQGDVLMLDNMLTAHGRMPFTGARRVVVAMTEPTEQR